ncbi:PAS domain S-box protein [Rudanella paleaurantiibacter]|uniref:histidine kinase n=1 Tax=Rudanella paleaurantiibacter TaxID=2614655 RepID=A0A7J5TUI1_9BACT|nr:ATP-binding protein [Rudanella paleaurantiibacter]KAB7727668.1 PAS domain S-box protein [Rudanella paleaurantiibacter]
MEQPLASFTIPSAELSVGMPKNQIDQLLAQQKQLEAQIKALEDEKNRLDTQWQSLFDGLGEANWSVDLRSDQLHRSPIYYQCLGYPADSQPPADWQTLVHPQDLQTWLYEQEACRLGRQVHFRVTYRIRGYNGGYYYLLDRGRVFGYSAEGQPLLLRGVSTILTDHHQQEHRLSRQASRLANLVAQLQEGVLLEDEHRTVVVANGKFCDMFRISDSPDTLTGLDCRSMVEQYKSFFRTPDTFVSRVNQILTERQPVLGEEMELADGRTFERDYIPLMIDGAFAGNLWKYSDISRRKRAEDASQRQREKYQRIIENMNLGLIEVDLDERVVYTNQSFCAMSGYEPDELIGRVASEIMLGGRTSDFIKSKNESRLMGATDTYEIAVQNKHGEAMWWLISGAPVYADTGEVIGSTGIHLDITKQKQLESELRIAKQQAEDSSRAKELFLANMSHEIRTPMNAILSLGQQLTKTTLTEGQQFLLTTINTAASNLLVILNDILDFSKIEAGQLSLEQIGFNLPELVKGAVHVLAHQAEEKQLELVTRIDSGIAPVLLGDPYRLNQILVNLLGNALKFTDQGRVTVACLGWQKEGVQEVELQVIDTGIGIDPDFKEKIFNTFTQEDGSIVRRYGGTGLGMSITKQLVGLMGGTIAVESGPQKGTTVTVRLSFPIGHTADMNKQEQLTPQEGFLPGKRILLVEDNEMNRLVVKMILKPYNVQITEVVNGKQAVSTLLQESFDLVLMDVQMPVMDGLEATRLIRRDISSTLPIIALTASAIRSEKEACYSAGMNDFLAKPFEERALLNQLTRWLDSGHSAPCEPPPPVLYSLAKLEAVGRGNREFIGLMVELFCRETPAIASRMITAHDNGDMKTVRELAHRIKPSIDNLEVKGQGVVIRQIEKMAQTDTKSEELGVLLHEFEQSIRAVVQQLKML